MLEFLSQSGLGTRLALYKLINMVACNFVALGVRPGIK